MKFNSGKPPCWVGQLQPGVQYEAGAVAVRRGGMVVVSKRDANTHDTPHWAELGLLGATPTRVSHKWHPEAAMYPAGDRGEMSDATEVCGDCWKDADFKNAFRPELHLYVIRELGVP